jgi:hypothetical protein
MKFQAFMAVAHGSLHMAFCTMQIGTECTASIFKVIALLWLDAEVIEKKHFCQLY